SETREHKCRIRLRRCAILWSCRRRSPFVSAVQGRRSTFIFRDSSVSWFVVHPVMKRPQEEPKKQGGGNDREMPPDFAQAARLSPKVPAPQPGPFPQCQQASEHDRKNTSGTITTVDPSPL